MGGAGTGVVWELEEKLQRRESMSGKGQTAKSANMVKKSLCPRRLRDIPAEQGTPGSLRGKKSKRKE